MTSLRFRTVAIVLAALALAACASPPPPVGSAGSNMVSYNCPEQAPSQPNCAVADPWKGISAVGPGMYGPAPDTQLPKYANVGDLIVGERLVPR